MATPVSSPYLGLNITAKSYDQRSGSLSDPSSYQSGQFPPTPPTETSYSSYPKDGEHRANKDRSSSNASISSYSKTGPRNSGNKKQVYLDISGPFPYFDQELKEEKEPESDSERELTKQEISKLEKQTLQQYGYVRTTFIAKTLQGQVFHGKFINNPSQKVVIKKTSKKLHKLGITVTKSGKAIQVKENIIAEAELMRKFMNNAPPTSLIEYYNFFEDSHFYYLIMEDGGTDYFDFVVKCHELIQEKKLSLSEWRKHSKHMFAQMVQFIRWMHKKMHCCYLDISLENMLISDTVKVDEQTGKISGCYIKFIDFGLSECFDLSKNPQFLCQKYVGKTHYKSPQVYGKKEIFCADKADVWSLGVALFMMVIGAPPYHKPVEKDITYQYVKYKQIAKLLQEWGRIKYVTSNLHDLLTKMLTFDESKRISLDEIVKHPWIKHYFPDDNTPNITTVPAHNVLSHTLTTNHDNIPQTDDESFPANNPHMVNSPISVSLSQQTLPNHTNGHGINQKINSMTPQQCFSYSVSRKSVSHSHSSFIYSPNRYRHGSAYSPYPVSPQPHYPYSPNPMSPNPMSPNGSLQNTPTPIIQSHTSKHDHSFYFAHASHDKKQKKSKKLSAKKGRKRSKSNKQRKKEKKEKKNKDKKDKKKFLFF